MSEASVEVSIAVVVSKLTEIEKKIDQFSADHEARIRTIERWMYAVPASLMAAVASLIIAYLNTTGK